MTLHDGSVLAVVGSREGATLPNRETVRAALDEHIATHGRPARIVTGDATGVDALARAYAEEHDIPCTVFRADWAKYGRAAGPIRNTAIVSQCTHMLALPLPGRSKGTDNSIGQARAAGIALTIVPLPLQKSE